VNKSFNFVDLASIGASNVPEKRTQDPKLNLRTYVLWFCTGLN